MSFKNIIRTTYTLTTIAVLSSCFNEDKWRCEAYDNYVKHENFGRLERKYIDKENHARETLVLKQYKSRTTDVELPLVVDGLYDTIQVGDEILKEKGSTVTIIKRGSNKIELTVERSNWCKGS